MRTAAAAQPLGEPIRVAGAADLGGLAALHAAAGLLFAGALSLDAPARGWATLACVVAYNIALPLLARSRQRPEWLALWVFLLPVSVFQVVPDWMLAELLETLVFPEAGGPRVGDAVPLAMAGMWVAPLFGALALAGGSPARAALWALAIFAGSEVMAPVLGLWEPRNATQVAGVALYVLPAEAALGWAAMTAFNRTRASTTSLGARVGAAAAVSVFYSGALALGFFFLERADWTLAL